jgi:RNA polymerase sigma-70 factor (ECF subfamily)
MPDIIEVGADARKETPVGRIEPHPASEIAAPERFEALFHDHADAVLAYARRRTDRDTAEEIVGETFTVAWRRLDEVPDPARPWLLGVARRALANSRRSSSRQRTLALRLVHQPQDGGGDPTGEIDASLSARAALRRLPPAEREAIELIAWEGLSSAEAAEVLGCSRSVFAVRLHRARRRLRQTMSATFEPQEAT